MWPLAYGNAAVTSILCGLMPTPSDFDDREQISLQEATWFWSQQDPHWLKGHILVQASCQPQLSAVLNLYQFTIFGFCDEGALGNCSAFGPASGITGNSIPLLVCQMLPLRRIRRFRSLCLTFHFSTTAMTCCGRFFAGKPVLVANAGSADLFSRRKCATSAGSLVNDQEHFGNLRKTKVSMIALYAKFACLIRICLVGNATVACVCLAMQRASLLLRNF